MVTEKQAQRCQAYLELARSAIDRAELRIAGSVANKHPGPLLSAACADIAAAARNMHMSACEVEQIAIDLIREGNNATPVDGVTAGGSVDAKRQGSGN